MYVLYKSKNILTLVTIGYIVGFVVGMYVEYSYGPKWPYWIYIAYIGLFGTGICRFILVLYFGRASRTKETLPDFREKCRVTRHSPVFRGLTGSQRTPGFWGVTPLRSLAPKVTFLHCSRPFPCHNLEKNFPPSFSFETKS